jgi:hypothetical protein
MCRTRVIPVGESSTMLGKLKKVGLGVAALSRAAVGGAAVAGDAAAKAKAASVNAAGGGTAGDVTGVTMRPQRWSSLRRRYEGAEDGIRDAFPGSSQEAVRRFEP